MTKLSHKQGIATGYNNRISEYNPDDYRANLLNVMAMMWTQSSGIPNGNHGLFHRYGIEALTIEVVKESGSSNQNNLQQKIMALLRIVEGTCRSLNNLLERYNSNILYHLSHYCLFIPGSIKASSSLLLFHPSASFPLEITCRLSGSWLGVFFLRLSCFG